MQKKGVRDYNFIHRICACYSIFQMISFSAPLTKQKEQSPSGVCFLLPECRESELHLSTASGGGRGLEARVRLNGDEASATREKTRSNTREGPSPNSATMFSIGQLKSHPRNQIPENLSLGIAFSLFTKALGNLEVIVKKLQIQLV